MVASIPGDRPRVSATQVWGLSCRFDGDGTGCQVKCCEASYTVKLFALFIFDVEGCNGARSQNLTLLHKTLPSAAEYPLRNHVFLHA